MENEDFLFIKLDDAFNVVETSFNEVELKQHLNAIMRYKSQIEAMTGSSLRLYVNPIGSVSSCNKIINVVKIDTGYEIFVIDDYKTGFDKLQHAFLSMHAAFFDYSIDEKKLKRLRYQNETICENISLDDLADRKSNVFKIFEDDLDEFVINLSKILNGEMNEIIYFRSSLIDGIYHWYAFERIYPDQKDGFIHSIIRNIDRFAMDRDKLIAKGYYDSLTGVLNKEGTNDTIKKMLMDAKDESYFISILDIDYFKSINDEYGHMFGDEVIKSVANAIKDSLSPSGRVGRIGGDEFLFIDKFDSCDDSEIKVLFRKVKLALQNINISSSNTFSISATIGCVASPKYGRNFEELYKMADKALYRGKTKGRDCHIIYDVEKHASLMENGEISYINNPSKKVSLKLSNTQFINKCLDKFLDATNIEKVFEDVIKDTCNFYLIDRAMISDDKGKIVASYVSEKYKNLDRFYECAFNDDYKKLFKSDNLMFSNEVSSKPCDDAFTRELSENGVKAMIQSIILTNDTFEGYISFEDLTSKRVWQRDEILYINILSKIISGFYHKYLYEKSLTDFLYSDPITGYDNLNEFKENINKIKFHSNRTLAIIDVRKFTFINEKYGFKAGDLVLKFLADSINANLEDDEFFCRIADDRFAILINTNDTKEISRRYQSLKYLIEESDNGIVPNISIYCGAYVILDGDDISVSIDRANQARKNAKNKDIRDIVFYDFELQRIEVENKILEERMQRALDLKEFLVYVQPCYFIKNKDICSMEALVRWNFEGKIISPQRFIPLFERNGFITKLDFYVYEEVCKSLRKWLDLGYKIKPISVNVSRKHLTDHDFLNKLNNLLDKYNIDKEYIALELTESLFVENEKLMITFVNNLSKAGYRIYMDDFGVAYSTLNLLSRMHVDVIKLDKAFIDNNLFNESEKIIISNLIKMAKELGISVLSEGIETEDQLKHLTKLKCDFAQGYWFAYPEPIETVFENNLKKK